VIQQDGDIVGGGFNGSGTEQSQAQGKHDVR
jgi:hypothetical protein